MKALLKLFLFPLAFPRRLLRLLYAFDIFISYAHDDGPEYAAALDATLSQTHKVYLDTRDLHAGHTLDILTRVRVRNAKLLVVVCRPAALSESAWVRLEVDIFNETGRAPVLIDVDEAILPALQNPKKETLSEWLAEQKLNAGTPSEINTFIWMSDTQGGAEMVPRLPGVGVADRVLARFHGDRVETRRLRVVTGALGLMAALTVGAMAFAFAAYLSERRATAEALANAALSAVNGNDLDDGFVADALVRVSQALRIEPTSNVLAAATRIEELVPGDLVYADRAFGPLGPLVVSYDGRFFVKEGNHSVHEIEPSGLEVVETWGPEDLAISGVGNITAGASGFTALSGREAVTITPEGREVVDVPSWHIAQAGGIRVFRNWNGRLEATDADSPPAPLDCMPSGASVAWHDFFDQRLLAVAGREGAEDKLWIVDLEECSHSEVGLRTQPMSGTIIGGPGLIVVVSPVDISVFDRSLDHQFTTPRPGVSAIAPISRPQVGFAVGDNTGSVAIFTIQDGPVLVQSDRLEKVLPGTVGGLVFSPEHERLIVSGKHGFFVDAALPGALASLPVTTARDGFSQERSIVFDRPPFAKTLHEVEHPQRIDAAISTPDRLVFADTEGRIFSATDTGAAVSIDFPTEPAAEGSRLIGLSAFGDDIFGAWGSDDASLILGIDGTGAEIYRKKFGARVRRMVAVEGGVIVHLSTDERMVEDGRTVQLLRYVPDDGTEAVFKVVDFNGTHLLAAVDPTSRFLALPRSDGFEFRPLSDLSRSCLAPLDDGTNQLAGVAAAFSPDGSRAVLGSWGGRLSIWRRDGDCWRKERDLDARQGRMVPRLSFDGNYVVGSTLEAPARLRRWNADTGEEIGVGYALDAREVRIVSADGRRLRRVNWLPFVEGPGRSGIVIDYVTDDKLARFDFMPDAIIRRACRQLSPLRSTGLLPERDFDRACP